VFNLLGPMANPGRVRRQVIGVANAAFAERMIETLRSHGSRHAWVVHGMGLDELTTTGRSDVIELDHGTVRHFRVDPEALGLARAHDEDLVGGDPGDNAAVVHAVVGGAPGPHRDIVVLNAAAGLVVGGKVTDLAEGITLARHTIDSGAAAATLDRLVTASQEAAS